MPFAEMLLVTAWLCLTAYALFGGADFGAGFWDLAAGGGDSGRRQRDLIEHSIGPIWEANHVWLIFVIVLTWTGVPWVFAAISSTLYIPLTLVALGIIARGSAFAFRKVSREGTARQLFGAAFALSSIVTPFFLGTVAGALASERVPPGVAAGHLVTSWVNPTSLVSGILAIGTTSYLAAVYLTHDARRHGDPDLAEAFRRRALAAGVATGVLALADLVVLHAEAPRLFHELTAGRALGLALLSATAGIASMALLVRRRFLLVRLTAGLAVAAILWGWGVGQFPYVLPGVTLSDAAATPAVLTATVIAVAVAGVIVLPALWWLYAIFQRDQGQQTRA